MAILHKNITASGDIHNPKWHPDANNGDYAWKNEKGELESIDELLLPAALNFVDGSVAPPTSNTNDIYILSSGASVNAGWGSVALQDWVKYDGAAWNAITPQKSSLCYDKTADSLLSFDGSAWAAIGGATAVGVVGIVDSTGAYTYYTNLTNALAAASSGQTVDILTNIEETSNITITCVNGVNINFNGYTYTLNNSGTANAFTVGAGVSMEMLNGKVKRTGGTWSNATRLCIKCSGVGDFTASAMIFKNDFGNAARFETSTRNINGGYYDALKTGIYLNGAIVKNVYSKGVDLYGIQVTSGKLYNGFGYSLNNYGIINTNSTVLSSIGKSDGTYGFYSTGNTFDCKGYSTSAGGFFISGGSFGNIFGYSTASFGVNVVGTGSNVYGYSSSSYGLRISNTSGVTAISGLSAFSSANIAFFLRNSSTSVDVDNINIYCSYNNAGGHGIQIDGTQSTTVKIALGTISVINASANCLHATATKTPFFANLTFSKSTTAVNANITNSQTNTPDSFGNILIG